MQEASQSAREGAGPPRAVAKLRLLNCYYSGQPMGGEMGICQHSLPQPEEKGGGLWPPVGPMEAPRPAPSLNPVFLLAARAACRLCVKCRLREVPYNWGLGSPPRVNSARGAARSGVEWPGCGGLSSARLGSARHSAARHSSALLSSPLTRSHGVELSVNSPGGGRVLGEKRPRY